MFADTCGNRCRFLQVDPPQRLSLIAKVEQIRMLITDTAAPPQAMEVRLISTGPVQ
jgi:hypothetical protein